MVLLDADAFLTQLTRILENTREKGTMYVTMKRYAGLDGKKGKPIEAADCRCLVRAVGGKQKNSTMVAAKDHRRFMKSYGNILKVSLDSLKRKERRRAEKKKVAG
uniref:Signal recognition particle 14 kDa protein n=1 Tax=Coccolithus braarudii TaxID=221442 RepID=A0A7S0Q5G9_9EUKA|mmetsp:Transcript_36737/g.78399  ORF Transcript_36737/g.78399 Transcript_36737/m.78399 type:complete len:105 (+) Transcript_36737:52-366(+)